MSAVSLESVEEYDNWMQNRKLMYTCITTRQLTWPSLTVEFLPSVATDEERGVSSSFLLLGTMTAGEPNQLLHCRLDLPILERLEAPLIIDAEDARSDEFGDAQVTKTFAHEGDVHRARHMPQNPAIVATKTSGEEVFVYDLRRDVDQDAAGVPNPTLRLQGHAREGYGLVWSPSRPGVLASAADDGIVCIWDVGAHPSRSQSTAPKSSSRGHGAGIDDVDWRKRSDHVIGTVGEDGFLMLWDTRMDLSKGPYDRVQAHDAEAYCLAFNPGAEQTVLTGGADETVVMRDLRALSRKLHTFEGHAGEIFNVKWAPLVERVFASSDGAGTIIVWDVDKVGGNVSAEDAEDNVPPELVFSHRGHVSKVSDFAWHPEHEAFICSTDADNLLQCWVMSPEVFGDDDDDDDEQSDRNDNEPANNN